MPSDDGPAAEDGNMEGDGGTGIRELVEGKREDSDTDPKMAA